MSEPLRYFRYVSRAKVDMLDAQLRRFRWPQLKAKAEVRGVSVEATSPPPDDNLIRRVAATRKRLERRKLLVALPAEGPLELSPYYADTSPWREGLFSFVGTNVADEKPSSVVTYLLWKQRADALILLAGSPLNVIGEPVAREGVTAGGTDGTTAAIASFAQRILRTDEPAFAQEEAPATQNERTIPIGWFDLPDGVALALLCATQLQRLPLANIDVVFRLFHRLDLDAAAWTRSALSLLDGKADEETLRAFWNFRAVYVGSPIYTARA